MQDLMKERGLTVSFDRDFEAVLLACSRPGPLVTHPLLLPPRALFALSALHDHGFAHSYEVRDRQGCLIAGGFGIVVGRAFVTHATFGESRAAALSNAVLNHHLAKWGFELHETLCRRDAELMGFTPMSRKEHFLALLVLSSRGKRTRWQIDPSLCGNPAPERLAA